MEKLEEGSLRLKVTEALGKDVGRALARMDPADIKALGVEVGDIVEIVGKRRTVCKVMPAFKDDRGGARVQMDGISRGNAEVALDDMVVVRKVLAQTAQRIVLSATTAGFSDRDLQYIGTRLDGLPVLEGDRIRGTLFGSRSMDFLVQETTPKGAVLIAPTTLLTVAPARTEARTQAVGRPAFSYEDVGGLRREVQRVREIIELPLRYPEVFARLGIDAPKGVLLYGPPGCGKTLIARAVAHETDVRFFSISGPEIMQKFYGESEGHLRKLFDEATKQAPSIIFIDEIDSIAPKREELGGEHQVERRVVAQLLSLMDGLKSRGQVIVIAATNLPNALDPALRRPGRFDREIVIPIPDRHGRLEILEIHSRGMPLATDVDLPRLADITHGFVGADLEALCREAAMICVRRILPEIDFAQATLPYESLQKLELCKEDFLAALREVEPSALREVFVEVPTTTWEDVGGLDRPKRLLREVLEWPLQYPDLFEAAGVKPLRGILLSGPPGCGKTLLAQAAASATQVNFISVKGPALLSKYIGESERAVREVFRKAKQAAPCLVFFDEIDALVPRRGSGASEAGVSERVVGQFLAELDGIEKLSGVLVLAATNRPDMVDPALLRPGRFDVVVEISLPDEQERLAILQVQVRGKPVTKEVRLETIAANTDGLTGADLSAICQHAALNAIRERIDQARGGKEEHSAPSPLLIQPRHFESALNDIRK
ncbi:MAG: CDC48 family AAA ATPase [Nitrosomonadaceae bacterium]|nr:CDC48 family AAA ATPase [Nitrosomonadaceae bacterium]